MDEQLPAVLFVDDEPNILSALKRTFCDNGIRVLTATSGPEALEMLLRNPVSVIIADRMMPGMSGIDLLERAKDVSPESVRVMMTGYIDTEAAIEAINRGEVYKFITKPWGDDEIKKVVHEAMDRHNVVQFLKNADEYSIQAVAQTIELKDPYTKGHCERVARYADVLAAALGLDEEARRDIRRGSWLHDCGKIGVPEAILNHPGPLTDKEMNIVKKHACWGADVGRHAHLPERVINVILHHHERYDGTGYPSGLKGETIPLEARIVAVADIYDALTSARSYRKALSRKKAIAILQSGKGTCSDPGMVDVFIHLEKQGGADGEPPARE